MKAIIQSRYGSPDVLTLGEVEKPEVLDDEVLVRVRAASVHPDVWHVVSGLPYILRIMGAGLLEPKDKIPGTDVAGHVEAVGKSVTSFRPGDEVFGETLRGMQWRNGGAYAEYVAAPEAGLALKPPNVSFEQAASVPTSGIIALVNLRQAGLKAGQAVLINGAGGGVGSIALQIAKASGATVTAVDSSEKLDSLRSLGADHVVDYTRQDFTAGSERYDLIFDIPGNHPFSAIQGVLTPAGVYVLIGHDHFGEHGRRMLGSIPRFMALALRTPFTAHLPKLNFSMPPKKDLMATLSELLAAGKLTPFIEKAFPLAEVPDAIRYLQGQRAGGKVVVTV